MSAVSRLASDPNRRPRCSTNSWDATLGAWIVGSTDRQPVVSTGSDPSARHVHKTKTSLAQQRNQAIDGCHSVLSRAATVVQEIALLAEKPWLIPNSHQPGSLGDEISKIDRYLDREPEPLPAEFISRFLASVKPEHQAGTARLFYEG